MKQVILTGIICTTLLVISCIWQSRFERLIIAIETNNSLVGRVVTIESRIQEMESVQRNVAQIAFKALDEAEGKRHGK